MCVGSRVAAISSALSTAIYEWQTWPSFISVYAEINNGCRDASRDSSRDSSNTAANDHLVLYMSLKSE